MTKSMLVRSVVLTAAVTALAGCSSISSTLGLERHIPDETQVTVRPALTWPCRCRATTGAAHTATRTLSKPLTDWLRASRGRSRFTALPHWTRNKHAART